MKITVLGAGKSGIAAVDLAIKNGYEVFVSDMNKSAGTTKLYNQLKKQGVDAEFGQHSERVFEADKVILSPGIPRTSDIVKKCLQRSIPVISEIEFAYLHTRQSLIGITGSNGKTTTTNLLGKMLEKDFSGRRTGGNIGIPLSNIIDKNDTRPISVELSSFQLESSDQLSIKTAILLNISPNHLDWYDSMNDYVDAKLNILKNSNENSELIINANDHVIVDKTNLFPGKRYFFSITAKADAQIQNQSLYILGEPVCKINELNLKGPHHLMNMLAASLAAKLNGVKTETIKEVLLSFKGLEHRMEFLDNVNGIDFYNDSKSTSVEALKMALQSFNKEIILLTGGKHKGASYKPVYDLIKENCKVVFAYGASAKMMQEDWNGIDKLHLTKTMDEAFLKACHLAKEGDIILLSPACSSFDQFNNFEERGEHFKKLLSDFRKRK